MLIRVKRKNSGIKDYLENGQKQDRFFSRNELDERIMLSGNLEHTDAIIESIDAEKPSRYFHYTLSFKEHHIDQETLKAVATDFEKFIKAAYEEHELEFYAEAHLPKIKSYQDGDGNHIERLPHIHVVIPKVNLLNGKSYDPLLKSIIPYLNAFQEDVNNRYGLESPKDNLRTTLNSSSEMIMRYKQDIFTGHNKEIKSSVLDLIMEHNPQDQQELCRLLADNGYAVKIRNANKPELSYINIKYVDDPKGVNLKDVIFRNEFLSLNIDDKITQLNGDVSESYRVASVTQVANDKHLSLLHEWYDWKALDVRYSQSMNNSERDSYAELSDDDKKQFLQRKHSNTTQQYTQILQENNDDGIRAIDVRELHQIDGKIRRNFERVEHNLERITVTNTSSIRGLTDKLSARPNTREHRANIELINAERASKHSTLDQTVNEVKKDQVVNNNKEHLAKLNATVRADVLLELAEKTHGLNQDIYQITVDSKGYDRIQCGNRNLNIIDFTTKELNLSFKEAIPYLDNVINMQNDLERSKQLREDRKQYLIDEYKEWLIQYKDNKANLIKESGLLYQQYRTSIIENSKNAMADIRSNKNISYQRKNFEIALIKAQRVIDLDALKKSKAEEDKFLRNEFNTDMRSAYRRFLIERATDKDNEALEELRRLRINFDPTNSKISIKGLDDYQDFRLNINCDIDENGTINYRINDQLAIQDYGKRIDIIKGNEDNIKLSLELAIQKFGNKLQLDGDDAYKQRVVETALKHNLRIEFLDEYSKSYYQELKQQLANNQIQLQDFDEKFVTTAPARIQYVSTNPVDVLDDNQRVKTKQLHTVKDLGTGQLVKLTSRQLDYIAAKQTLESGQLFDVTNNDGELKFKQTRESVLRREFKKEILAQQLEKFHHKCQDKYAVDANLSNIQGTFIKLDKTRYGKEFALIKTNNGVVRLDKPEMLEQIKQHNPSKGSQVIASVVKQEQIAKTKAISKLKIDDATKYIKLDRLQLIADLSLPKVNNQKIIKEALGEVSEVRTFDKHGTKLNRTVINTPDGTKQVFYLDEKDKLVVGSYCYARQLSGRQINVVDLTNEFKSEMLHCNKQLHEQNYDAIAFGKLTKVGYTNLRGNDVFFVEYNINDHSGSKTIRKHGDAIKEQVFENQLKPNDLIGVIDYHKEQQYQVTQDVTEFEQLDVDIEAQIDEKIHQQHQVELEVELELEQNISVKSQNDLER